MFKVNWKNLGILLTPGRIAKPKFLAWLQALTKPVWQLYEQFLTFCAQTIYSVSFTGQVIYLEKILNDKFNNGGPAYVNGWKAPVYPVVASPPVGIYISPSSQIIPTQFVWNTDEAIDELYLYNDAENPVAEPPTIYPVYIWNSSEYASRVQFIIHVPYSVFNIATNPAQLAALVALVNKYRMAGKQFQVVNYTP